MPLAFRATDIPTQPPPRGVQWIDLEEAARRSGFTDRHLRRLCGDRWLAIGLARLETTTDGGKARWMVREDADAKLARVKFPEQIPAELGELTAAQREKLFQRLEVLREWENAIAVGVRGVLTTEQATARFLGEWQAANGWAPKSRTLYEWQEAYRQNGKAGLYDARWFRYKRPHVETDRPADGEPFIEDLKRIYLHPNKPSKRSAWNRACQLAENNGHRMLAYRSACRILDAIPRGVLIRKREGKDAYTAKAEASIERDYSTLHTNEMWCGDHHQLDVFVADVDGSLCRPWITAWLDMRSRKIVGWCLFTHAPNTNTILSALRGGILENGVPKTVYIDNGKDFDSYALHGRTKAERRKIRFEMDADSVKHTRGVLLDLDISAKFALPYHGQSKPIERWFKTLEEDFGKLWPTYCGNKPENKPEGLEDRKARGQAPKLEDFRAELSRYIVDVYNNRGHAGDGMNGHSPNEIFESSWNGAAKRTADAGLLQILLMRTTKPVKVGKNGVVWHGLRYGQYELASMLGEEVYLRIDERDVSQVQVWTADDRFVCNARSNARLPVNADAQMLSEAHALKSKNRKLVSEYLSKRPQMAADHFQLMHDVAHAQAEARRENEPPPGPTAPGSFQPVGGKIADQMPAIQREQERQPMRRAAGAEDIHAAIEQAEARAADQERHRMPSLRELMAARERDREEAEEPVGRDPLIDWMNRQEAKRTGEIE